MSRTSCWRFLAFLCLSIGLESSCKLAAAQSSTPAKDDFRFEVASVRPSPCGLALVRPGITQDGFITYSPLAYLIMFAYAPEEYPAWLSINAATRIIGPVAFNTDCYEINARVAETDREAWGKQGARTELFKSAMRNLLKERFKLVMHQQPTEVPGYHLLRKGQNAKLKETLPGSALPPGGQLMSGGVMVNEGTYGKHYYGATMADFTAFLCLATGLPVKDDTGLTARYEFKIQRATQMSYGSAAVDNFPIDHLGLELKPGKVPGRILVIDHLEKTTEN